LDEKLLNYSKSKKNLLTYILGIGRRSSLRSKGVPVVGQQLDAQKVNHKMCKRLINLSKGIESNILIAAAG
jgi:hypothetical protein